MAKSWVELYDGLSDILETMEINDLVYFYNEHSSNTVDSVYYRLEDYELDDALSTIFNGSLSKMLSSVDSFDINDDYFRCLFDYGSRSYFIESYSVDELDSNRRRYFAITNLVERILGEYPDDALQELTLDQILLDCGI